MLKILLEHIKNIIKANGHRFMKKLLVEEINLQLQLFLIESRPELVMRRGQSKFKTKDHGALAGLPYSVKKNGSTSTLKTEENVDIFMDVVEEIVYDPNTIWFEEGTYYLSFLTNRFEI